MKHRHLLRLAAALAATLPAVDQTRAAQLRVEPVLLELTEPAAASSLLVRNEEAYNVAVQTRIYRWVQEAGAERLEPTADVAASPPIVRLAPGADYTVRIVRTRKQPVEGEEAYRVVVDQLPDPPRYRRTAVTILVRQSIPVFFQARRVAPARVAWKIRREADRLVVSGTNSGDDRMRVAGLTLRDAAGSVIQFGNGLVGYVLGRSAMDFIVPSPPAEFGRSGPVAVSADTNNGPVRALAAVVQGQP